MEDVTVINEGKNLVFQIKDQEDLNAEIYYGYDNNLTTESKHLLLKMEHLEEKIENPDINHRLFFVVVPINKKSYVISTRLVNLDGTDNFRDIGGYRGIDGRRVKWGCIYRSDELSNLTARDIKYLEDMHLKTIVDYRNENEANAAKNKKISGVTTYSLDPNAKIAQLASGSLDDENKKNISTLELLKQGKFDSSIYGDPEVNMYK